MTVFDTAVIGAGPAGCVAATLLARAGQQVCLIDPGRFGPQVGETLPSAAVRLLRVLDLPAPPDGPHRPVRGVISNWGGPPLIDDFLNAPDGLAWRLDRPQFDQALEETAHKAGALRAQTYVTGVAQERGRWRIETSETQIVARRMIDATGRRAVAARMLGAPRVRQDPLVAIWAIGRPMDTAAQTDRTLIDADALGWWYGAVLPCGRPLAIYHCAPERANRIRRTPNMWLDGLNRSDLLSAHLDPSLFDRANPEFCDASGAFTHPVYGDGWLACGDAALSFDPVASQGLFHAIRSAQAAAGVLLAEDMDRAGRAYAQEMEEVWHRYAAHHDALYRQRHRAA